MTVTWSPDALERIAAADELEIATRRADGTLRRYLPIWVVRVDDQVYVRTWHRRDTGWYGHAVEIPRARIRVPGLESDVAVEDIGLGPSQPRTDIDASYRTKYERYGASVDRMATDEAAATTLRLRPDRRR